MKRKHWLALALLCSLVALAAAGTFTWQVKNNGTVVYTRQNFGMLNCDGTTITCTAASGGVTISGAVPTIASGTAVMGTSAIGSGACAAAVQETTVTSGAVANVATTDAIVYTPAANPTGITGYAVSATGSVYVWAYPTAGHVNFTVCNNTSGSLTPGALTFNWRVAR